MFAGKTYWIIGASEGLGRAIAQKMDRLGATVILSARNKDRLEALADQMQNARVVALDVTDPASVSEAAQSVGQCDGIIYSAGFYEPVSAKKWDAPAVEAMCEVNFLGAVRVLGHVTPKFVAKNSGHIVLIGSLAGFRGLPGAIGYGASKSALMHLAQSLQADLFKTGVKVQLINPGFIRTRLSQKNDFTMPQIMNTAEAADRVLAAMQKPDFQTSFPKPFSWLFSLGQILPDFLFLRLFQKP